MEAHVLVQSYDTYGGHASISIIGDLLEQAAKDLDCGVAIFEATACFRTNRPPKRTLEALLSRFHAELEALPKLRWERKKRHLSIRYESRLGLAEEVLEPRPASSTLLQSALQELAAVLGGQRTEPIPETGTGCAIIPQGGRFSAPARSSDGCGCRCVGARPCRAPTS